MMQLHQPQIRLGLHHIRESITCDCGLHPRTALHGCHCACPRRGSM